VTAAKPKWWEGTITGFDNEATGINPHEDRIVTASLVHRIPGQRPNAVDWYIDPGIDIPAEAAAVHGWTRSKLVEFIGMEGAALRVSGGQSTRMARDGALNEIAAALATAIYVETPIVIANAPYDTTLLDAELARNGIDPITARPTGWRGVVDPMVLNKQWDPYRKTKGGCRGSRQGYDCGGCGATDSTLTGLCRHYGIVLAAAHSSSADALAAVRLSVRLAQLWPEIARWLLPTLHKNQVAWRRDQMVSLRRYFDKNGTPHDGCCPEWPVHVACAPAKAVAS
jgi:DNA polymerase-3 subunit epsilon